MNLKIGITVIVLIKINLNIHAQNTFPTSGNVGIGTTNPAASLQVHINGNQRAFRIKNDLNNAQFNFWTTEASGNKQLRIDEDTNGGNVATFLQNGTIGFGTTTPFSGTSNTGLHINKGTHSSVLLGDPKYGRHYKITHENGQVFNATCRKVNDDNILVTINENDLKLAKSEIDKVGNAPNFCLATNHTSRWV